MSLHWIDTHELYDILHILGVTLFFGGLIISLAWLFLAERGGHAGVIRSAVIRANRVNLFITAPGIALIILSGVLQMPSVGGIFFNSWLIAGLLLFALAVMVWLVFFIPCLQKILHISANSDDALPPEFFTTLHRLYFFGASIIMLPLGTMLLAIFKPIMW